jgi:hypothetical protein
VPGITVTDVVVDIAEKAPDVVQAELLGQLSSTIAAAPTVKLFLMTALIVSVWFPLTLEVRVYGV